MSTTPSAEALSLAVKLSGHTVCIARHVRGQTGPSEPPCNLCLGDATTIDRELQLPQRNAALLLAEAVCEVDAESNNTVPLVVADTIDQLRDALQQIK